jgi:hypothetical protein
VTEDPVGHVPDCRVVGDEEHGLARLPVEAPQQPQDHATGLEIELAGGLITQQDRRILHQCPGDRHPLLLASRQLGWEVIGPFGETDLCQDEARPFGGVAAGELGDQLDVLGGGEGRDQVEELEDEAHGRATKRHPVVGIEPGQVDALDGHRALGGVVDGTDQVEQRGLSGAARPQDHGEFARSHLEIDPLEGMHGGGSLAVGLPDVLQHHAHVSAFWFASPAKADATWRRTDSRTASGVIPAIPT